MKIKLGGGSSFLSSICDNSYVGIPLCSCPAKEEGTKK